MNGFQFLALILALTAAQNPANYLYTVLPSSSYINVNGSYFTQASPKACYADCYSCQIQTNVCEDCYGPYFEKAPTGQCQLNPSYTLESSSNELMSGAGFIISAQSWSNYKIVNCSAIKNNPSFTDMLVAIQPSVPTQIIQYNRTLSIHDYMIISFQLITSDWTNASSMLLTFNNQAGSAIIPPYTQYYLPNVPTQSLCSPLPVDQRFSVTVQIQDESTTALSLSILGQSGSISIATWALVTGLCDPTCASCSYSVQPTACLTCNFFLQQVADGSCSRCPTGFNIVSGSYSFCQKCPIQYQTCSANQQACYYSQLNTSTTSYNCSLTYPNSFYSQASQLNSQTFVGSLWTVGGLPNPSLYVPCGTQTISSYSYVGQAQPFQPITRNFATMPSHLGFSISFNVFVVDLSQPTINAQFSIYINGNLYDVKYLTLTGMSNVCGGAAQETFTTFPPTQFYDHTQTTDVNLTIVANTQWGIRDFRIVYQICDSSCLICGTSSCLQCVGYLQLKDNVCSACPPGFGLDSSAPLATACVQCPANCLNCTPVAGNMTCLVCSAPFFLFEGNCKKRTNIGDTSVPPALNGSIPQSCLLNAPSSIPNSTKTSLTLSTSTLSTQVSIPQSHYRKIVQFYVVRVGVWSATDHLDVYLNDLLMLNLNYSSYGNKLCSNNSNQSDYLSYHSLDFTDSNSTLSVYFQVVSNNNATLTFGVGNLLVYPVGCSSCLAYPFTYRIQYTYDSALNVQVSFSRTYRNSNATLFQHIFSLQINGVALPYYILSNNSVTYTLQAYPEKDTILGNLSLVCLYPEMVTTDTSDTINAQPFFSRLLTPTYATSKVVDNTETGTTLHRFTPLENHSAVSGVRTFFQVVSRAVIYIGFAVFFLGLQTVCTHFMHNLQKIWLHIFLAALTAPALLKYALSGFRQVQNQNIAINPTVWEKALPLQLYYSSPSYLYSYYTDVNFFRNIYNIGIAFAIFLVYLLVMHFVTKYCISRRMANSNLFWRHLKITFHRRPYFYFNSVIFYQYLTLILACFLQFSSLTNLTNQGSFSGVSAAAAVVAFIIATAYPIAHFLYLRYKQEQLGAEKSVEYSNRYHEIFFRFIHKDIWEQGEIGYDQRFYNLYRFGQLWWLALVVASLTSSPKAQLYLILLTHAVHMLVILFTGLSRNLFFKICKALELALFIGLEIVLLVCQTQNETLVARSFNTLGSVAIALLFAIILLSLIRSIYTAWLLQREYTYARVGLEIKSRVRQGEVVRRDQFYSSENNDNQPAEVEIAGTDRE